MPVKKATYARHEDTLLLDRTSYERLRHTLEEAKKELKNIADQKVLVRQDDNVRNIDDPSATWQLLLEQEAAKNEEISKISHDIRRAKVLDEPVNDEKVSIGDTVTLTFYYDDGDVEHNREFKLVAISPRVDNNEVSTSSPIGAGILGKKIGETITVQLPEKHSMDIVIISKKMHGGKNEE